MTRGSYTVAIRRMRPPQRGQASTSRSNALRINAAHDQERTLRVGAASSETTPAPTVPASEFAVGTLPWATTRPRQRAWEAVTFY
jgi:hypothetical protein